MGLDAEDNTGNCLVFVGLRAIVYPYTVSRVIYSILMEETQTPAGGAQSRSRVAAADEAGVGGV